ncbi:hypothetical protein G6F70_000007 [Rhizopus microsporus]|uniref:Small ribosomal subunit protein mS38 n=1 Tax=Rhizopus microsporus TaxID=58291 RepID=A0A0A1NG61_RHIZD|nr:hypothetical protein G6F71_002136 [Rhizopus microsporus]KAG1204870.1 hypothetical protein G6F70_000007 [Rhizopus microsporus]KAG1216520.1 hypothetical protein G6F69_000091 [Rhizopus microsporus]KAG1236957.1 hypothetical protein G6F67_001566 [Rhizopus microsporus]KAG1269510.1 hypothetical protein G6F68_000231 [Rhizopus microsporus]
MLSRVLSGHSFLHIVRRAIIPTWAGNTQRAVSTLPTIHSAQSIQLLGHNVKETKAAASISDYVSRLRPFSAPPAPQPITTPLTGVEEQLELTSVLRKRRLKMNKHKHKKLRKRTRALRKRLGK